jgi:hypothetical protein
MAGFGACADGLHFVPWGRWDAGRLGAQRERGCTEVPLEHSRQPGVQQLPHHNQGISASGKGEPVKCVTCHADEAAGMAGSVHADGKDHPCTSCHGDAHAIVPEERSEVGGVSAECSEDLRACHGTEGMAKKHGLQSVYPLYIDSIHGFALSKEGLLVAANCQSCHGSHHILSHKDPQSATYKANIPNTCGKCHAGMNDGLRTGRSREGCSGGEEGCAGVLGLPHGARDSAADGV